MSTAAEIPDVAILIPSVNGAAMLLECLAALEPQAANPAVEVIVADRCGDGLRQQVAERFPWVVVLAFPVNTSIPALRDAAFRHSRAPIVAIIEDHCLAGEDWIDVVRAAHRGLPDDAFAAVGGPVENAAVDRLVDWAAFLCEYSQAMGPIAAGETAGVPGNNVAYRRDALERAGDARAELWEFFLHADMARDGSKFMFVPTMVVRHKRPFRLTEFLAQRFLYSRSFAGMRARGMSLARRLAYAGASLALPPVLLARIVRAVLKKRRHVDKLVLSLPLLSLFAVSWAAGEIAGYLFGGGRSLEKVT